MGVNIVVTGFPVLSEVVCSHGGQLIPDVPLSEEQERIRDDFRAKRGYWSEMNETLLEVDADMFEAYTA